MSEGLASNSLDEAITGARAGALPMKEFFRLLVSADLMLPSAQIVQADGTGFMPLFHDKQGVSMLVAFTDKNRALGYARVAPYLLMMKGGDLLSRFPKGYGLVINPGQDIGFDISADGIQRIISELDVFQRA